MPIEVILITNREIEKLNKKWFGRNRPTDVIAFDTGEIYISIDTARRQARERKITLQQELLRLAVHGLAHICGYNDLTLKEFCRMREIEWEMLCGIS